ncbi:MAG: enoyl-CoA hydratase-related protein, partial [Desulfobacteraceae bacterium]
RGRVIKVEEASKLGLVDEVLPVEGFSESVRDYALDIAQWPLSSLRAIKRAVHQGLRSDLRGHLDYISSQQALLSETEEHREAVKKMLQRD